MIKNVLIFVGGYGKRLGNLTKKTPKPLLLINNKPFINYLLEKIIKIKPKKIIFLCKYKNSQFLLKYNKKKINKTFLSCIIEKKKLGTGGSLFNAKKYITNNTLVVNGDTFFNINFNKFNKISLKKNVMFMCLVKNKIYKSNKKLSQLNIKKKLVIFAKKNSNLMNAGFYVVNKKIIKFLKKDNNSLEKKIIPKLIEKKLIYGKIFNNDHIDIGTKKNLKYFCNYSKNIKDNFKF
jgi:D-glycero-alpha-D-manno-heptose 1-phosphate guanylyltransferase